MVRVSLAGRVNRNPKEERYVLDDVQQNSRAATVEERAESRTHHQSAPAGLAVCGLGLTLHSGAELLRDVNFAAAPGTLTAIIGSSGAGKTILAGLVGGMICPSRGTVTFARYNVHADFSRLRRRIGLVPQDPPLLARQASSILTGRSTKEQFSGVSRDHDGMLPVICRQLNSLPSRRAGEIGTSAHVRDEETGPRNAFEQQPYARRIGDVIVRCGRHRMNVADAHHSPKSD